MRFRFVTRRRNTGSGAENKIETDSKPTPPPPPPKRNRSSFLRRKVQVEEHHQSKPFPLLVPAPERIKPVRTSSFDTLDSEHASDATRPENSSFLSNKCGLKSVAWADHKGVELAIVHYIEHEKEAFTRFMVLLMHRTECRTEVVHCEYASEDRLKVSDLLTQLPKTACSAYFRALKYRTLCRDGLQLINTLALQDYGVQDSEIFVAVPQNGKPMQSMAMALKLLTMKGFVKKLRRAKHAGKGVKKLKSSRELDMEKQEARMKKEGAAQVLKAGVNVLLIESEKQNELDGPICVDDYIGGDRSTDEDDDDANSEMVQEYRQGDDDDSTAGFSLCSIDVELVIGKEAAAVPAAAVPSPEELAAAESAMLSTLGDLSASFESVTIEI